MVRESPDREILEAALAAARALGRDECLEAAARGCLRLFAAQAAIAFAISQDGDSYRPVSACRRGGALPAADRGGVLAEPLGEIDASLIARLTEAGPEAIDAQLLASGEERREELADSSALLLPLESTAGRAALVVMLVENQAEPEGWRERARELAHELVPALDNARDVELLRELVLRDDTTDCYNRRCLEENLDDEVQRSRRFKARFSIIFLDMDNLKDVNTTHGHAAGSKVLRDAALRIGRSIRSIDKLYRFGGDEFVAILPGTGLSGATEVAQRVRRELSGEPFETPEGALVRLTASTGVAVWPDHGETGRGVIAAADDAMRLVKSSGKDGVGSAAGQRLSGARRAPQESR